MNTSEAYSRIVCIEKQSVREMILSGFSEPDIHKHGRFARILDGSNNQFWCITEATMEPTDLGPFYRIGAVLI